MRPSHYHTRYKYDLTPRQREVLRLVALGRTNAEIANELGLSLDGAKWHVREILGKLDVSSREEAASIWQAEQRPVARFMRALTALVPGGWALRATMAIGGGAVAIAAVVFALTVLRGDDDDIRPATDDSETPTSPAASPTPQSTPAGPAPVLSEYPAIEAIATAATTDANTLLDYLKYEDFECIIEPVGIGGPPFCPPGVAEGTVVQAFQFSSCEGSLALPDASERVFREMATTTLRVHSVFELSLSRRWTGGMYGVLLEAVQPDGAVMQPPRLLSVTEAGEIVALSSGCAGSADEVFLAYRGYGVLQPPAGLSASQVQTVARPRETGVVEVDMVIQAVVLHPERLSERVASDYVPCFATEDSDGPRCPDGIAPGTALSATPVVECGLRRFVLSNGPGDLLDVDGPVVVHSAFVLRPSDEAMLGGVYGLVLEGDWTGLPGTGSLRGVLAAIGANGRITGIGVGCSSSADDLFNASQGEMVLLAPE